MLSILIQPRLLSLRNSINRKLLIRRLPLVILGAGFWILLYIVTIKILFYLKGIEFFGGILVGKFFSMTFFSLMGFLILSNIITALSSFYLSRDIPFLLTKPVELSDIIKLKSLETILNSSWMVISFVPPVLIAFGVSLNTPVQNYIFVFAVFFLFVLVNAGIGISIAHVLTRIFPAGRMRNILLGSGLILFLMIYFFLKSIIPKTPDTPEELINSFLSFKADFPLLPGFWMTQTASSLFRSEKVDFFYVMVLLSNSIFFLLASFFIGNRLYIMNLKKVQTSHRGSNRSLLDNYYPEVSTAIPYKDTKIFFRDTGQWSQLLIICSLILVYVHNFRSIPVETIKTILPYAQEMMLLINMALAGLVLSAVAGRFIYVSVSLEGHAFWIIKSSPVDIRRFLRAKFLHGFIPVSVIMVVLVFLTNLVLNAGVLLMLISVLTIFLLSFSVSGLGTGFGAVYPNFRYENIAAVSMSMAGMVFMVIAFSMVFITISVEAWIFYLFQQKSGLSGMKAFEIFQIVMSIILICAINAAGFYIPMKRGIKHLSKLPL